VHGDYVTDLLPAMLLLGVGAGLVIPAVTSLAMSGATEANSGLLSGLANTTLQIGAALGLAVLATLATARTGTLLGAGQPAAAALTGGYHLAFGVAAATLLAAAGLAAGLLRPAAAAPEPVVVTAEAEAA
jgi:MFS family permease